MTARKNDSPYSQGTIPHLNTKNLKEIADGDQNYHRELVHLYISVLDDLQKEFKEVIASKNTDSFRAMIHKYKASIELLEWGDITFLLEDCWQQLHQGTLSNGLAEKAIFSLQEKCEKLQIALLDYARREGI